jgi:hypothetical protein
MGARVAGNPHAACDVAGTRHLARSKGLLRASPRPYSIRLIGVRSRFDAETGRHLLGLNLIKLSRCWVMRTTIPEMDNRLKHAPW